MEIGVRRVGNLLIFFGRDGVGGDVHPDLGIEGYKRILGIIADRRKKAGRLVSRSVLDPDTSHFHEWLPDGVSIVEHVDGEWSTFMVYGRNGLPLSDRWLPSVQDAFAIVKSQRSLARRP